MSKNRGAGWWARGAAEPSAAKFAKRPFAKNEAWTRCGRRQLSSSQQVAFDVLKARS
jgi:hypothetical protein